MRILQITYNLSPGGAERFAVDLSNSLACYECNQVILLSISETERGDFYLSELSDNVQYLQMHLAYLNRKSYIKIYNKIKELNPDIVHAHTGLKPLLIPSLLFRRCKYFHTIHSLASYYLENPRLKWIYRFFYRFLINPVTISEECRKSFIELYNNNKLFTINNGRNRPPLSSDIEKVRQEISSYKNHPNDKVFIHLARFHKLKNQELLLSSFSSLVDKYENIILLIIGDGFVGTEIYSIYKDCSKIHFLGVKKNVGDYLYCGDFFIMSSIWEGLPLSLLEAMSYGLIPISTSIGGIKDVINDGISGFLSQTIEKTDFQNTIIRALENKENITNKRIKEIFELEYSMEKCTKRYMDLYFNNISVYEVPLCCP